MMGNRPRAFPLAHREPAPQYLTGWLAGRELHLGLAGMAGKLSLRFVHFYPPYREQVLQLSVAQVPQALAPVEVSSELRQNLDGTLGAGPPHFGHTPLSSALLIGRSSSNFCSQSKQKYSYIGIVSLIRPRLLL